MTDHQFITREELLDNAVKSAAQEVNQEWQDAAGDIGFYFRPGNLGDKADAHYYEVLKNIENEYPADMARTIARESMADWIYDDVSSIMDHCGDRIFDAAQMVPENIRCEQSHNDLFIMIATACKGIGGRYWNEAMDKLIARHKE